MKVLHSVTELVATVVRMVLLMFRGFGAVGHVEMRGVGEQSGRWWVV